LLNHFSLSADSFPNNQNGKNNLSSAEERWLLNHDTLTVGYTDWPPVIIDSAGSPIGISYEYITTIFETIGLTAKFVRPEKWSDAFKMLKNKEIDMLIGASKNPSRDSFMLFSSPYVNFPYVIYTHQNSPLITSIQDLQDKTLAVENGYLTTSYLNAKGITVKEEACKSSEEALKKLTLEKVDAYIGNIGFCTYMVNKHGYANLKISAPALMDEFPVRFGIRDDWPELQSILTKQLQGFTTNQKKAIKDKYLKIAYEPGYNKTLVLKWMTISLIVITLIIILFALWNRSLQKQIKERKKAEQDLHNSQDKLIELNQVKSKIFSILGHDLKGPIGNLASFLSTLGESSDYIAPEKMKSHLNAMSLTANTSFSLLQNLLFWAKLQVSGITMTYEKANIYDLIYDTANLLKLSALSKNIKLEIQSPKDNDEPIIECDINSVSTILRNILSNALKYSPKDSEIKISAKRVNESIKVNITDYGIGMSEDKVNELFDTSNIRSKKGTSNERGTGLGLQVCKKFVDMHNGKITVISRPDAGSTFSIILPTRQKNSALQKQRAIEV